MSEIKPCPFCGATAERREYDHRHPYEPFGLIAAHSEDCFLNLPRDEEAMHTSWNTRPIEDDLAASRNRTSDACATVQRERDALREMLVHATDALRNLERANEEVCAARTVRTYHSYVSDGAEPLLLGLDNARERARTFLSRYEGEVR